MADTGSDLADMVAREAREIAIRLLEGRFLMSRHYQVTEGEVRGDAARPSAETPLVTRSSGDEVAAGDSGVPLRHAGNTPTEVCTLTFDNHKQDPTRDVADAEAYAEGLASFGFDARLAHEEGQAPVVDVTYPEEELDKFVLASAIVLHETGALSEFADEDPYALRPLALEYDWERLMTEPFRPLEVEVMVDGEGAAPQTDAGHTPLETSSDIRRVPEVRHASPEQGAYTQAHSPITLDEYKHMSLRERERVADRDVPLGFFGSETLDEMVKNAIADAAAINAGEELMRSQRTVSERMR